MKLVAILHFPYTNIQHVTLQTARIYCVTTESFRNKIFTHDINGINTHITEFVHYYYYSESSENIAAFSRFKLLLILVVGYMSYMKTFAHYY
jgi:hypothetical protein